MYQLGQRSVLQYIALYIMFGELVNIAGAPEQGEVDDLQVGPEGPYVLQQVFFRDIG